MKIATWNVNSINVRLQHVLDWLAYAKPDVLAVQETKITDEKFPQAEFEAAGYQVCFSGQKTYNGVAIISKTTANDIITDIPKLNDPQRRILAATIDDVRVVNLYVPNGSMIDSEKYIYKLNWLHHMQHYLQQQLLEYNHVVVLGDFNIAPHDVDVHSPQEWQDCVLVSKKERAALSAILDHGYCDVFRQFEQPENSFSWWDYRAAAFRRDRGLRIDLILANQKMSEKCQLSTIDKQPRTWERPSDHTPVIAEFM
jgi:exodeoxyribonuclease-3